MQRCWPEDLGVSAQAELADRADATAPTVHPAFEQYGQPTHQARRPRGADPTYGALVLDAVLRFDVRFRWWVVIFWLAVTVTSVVTLPSLGSVIRNDTVTFLPSDASSVRAARLAAPFLAPSGPTGIVVVSRRDGPLTPGDERGIEIVDERIRHSAFVLGVTDGAVSSDGQAFIAAVKFDSTTAGGNAAARSAVGGVRRAFGSGENTGLHFDLTGSLPILVDQQAAAAHTQNLTLSISVVLIFGLLILAFRAVLAPLVSLAPAVLALAVASPLIAESTKLGVEISSLLQLLLTALVLGAGTDYGLFLLFRYRENLGRGLKPDDAIVAAGERVGASITFSALTVIAALLSLLLASFG